MTMAFVSDLHLLPGSDFEKRFGQFLSELPSMTVTDFWMLGDVADFLVGPYSFWEQRYQHLFLGLNTVLDRGIAVHWALGNHDFEIQKIPALARVDFFDGERTLNLKVQGRDQKLYLAHGDLVDAQNHAYQRWRQVTRSAALSAALKWLPDQIAKSLVPNIGLGLSRKSRGRQRDDAATVKARYRTFAQNKFSEGYFGVFLGHCHVEDLFKEGERFYLNLGSGLDNALRYATWNPEIEGFPRVSLY
jgi:UDP-2,3-diacylglucosamine pyrophosphatase LpxH